MDKKHLAIPRLGNLEDLDLTPNYAIDVINWPDFPYSPKTTFRIAVIGENLVIRFIVRECDPRAVCTEDFQPVWEDSCVEFFCQIPGEKHYFNFEFNSLGTCVASSRLGQNEGVEFLCKTKMERIKRTVSKGESSWSLLVEIPLYIISDKLMSGSKFLVNFYKCGDKCDIPHYLSWNPIEKPKPAFHCPEFFGVAELG